MWEENALDAINDYTSAQNYDWSIVVKLHVIYEYDFLACAQYFTFFIFKTRPPWK